MNEQNTTMRIKTYIVNNLPEPTIIFPILLYLALYYLTTIAARSDKVIMLGRGVLPVAATAGAISTLSDICLVYLEGVQPWGL